VVWVEKLKEMGVTDEEFERFCARYPEFKANRELMAKLYLAVVKGVRVAEPRVVGEFQKVSELTVNVPSRIRVVVIQRVDRRAYTGCPKCLKKLNAAPNTVVECPRDGPVRAQVLEWNEVLAGDDSGEILLAFPPSVGDVPNPGAVIAVEGVLTEQEEFLVWRYSHAEVAQPPPAPATQPAPIQVQPAPPTVEATPTTPTATPTTSPAPAPAPTQPSGLVKCGICGKEFKSLQALKVHERLAHKKEAKPEVKPEAKPVEAKPEEKPQPKPEAKAEAKPQPSKFPEEALKLARVAALVQKPYEEFKTFITGKFPGIDVDALIKEVGAEVKAGKVVKMP
jgi:hypothetical protein